MQKTWHQIGCFILGATGGWVLSTIIPAGSTCYADIDASLIKTKETYVMSEMILVAYWLLLQEQNKSRG
jgi:hypothetical protein